jgi:hypothetical protein
MFEHRPLCTLSCFCRAKFTAAAEELLQLLTTEQESQQAASARADELVEVLLSCQGLPFEEQLLGPGPWLVSRTDYFESSSFSKQQAETPDPCVQGYARMQRYLDA